jgi:hypothetical protein
VEHREWLQWLALAPRLRTLPTGFHWSPPEAVPPIIGRKVRLKLPTWPKEFDGVVRRMHGPVLKEPAKGGKARFGRVYEVRMLVKNALGLPAADCLVLTIVSAPDPRALDTKYIRPSPGVFRGGRYPPRLRLGADPGKLPAEPSTATPELRIERPSGRLCPRHVPPLWGRPRRGRRGWTRLKVLRRWIGRDGKQVPVVPLSMPTGTIVKQIEGAPACLRRADGKKAKKGDAFKLVASSASRSKLRRWSGHMTYWGSDAAKCWAGLVVKGNEPFTSVVEYQVSPRSCTDFLYSFPQVDLPSFACTAVAAGQQRP